MDERLIEYLESIVDIKYEEKEGYLYVEFIVTFNDKDVILKLYKGNNNIKMYFSFECPICNSDVFMAMNEFNEKSDIYKAFHNGNDVIVEAFTYYKDDVETVRDMLDELLTDDYELVNNIINAIYKANSVDKFKVMEKIIDDLSEDKDE